MIIEMNNSAKARLSSVNWKTINAKDFYYGHHLSFFNNNLIYVEDYIGSMNLSGNELYRYPNLASALRDLKQYPILKRSYGLNTRLQGIDFIENFHETIASGLAAFKIEHAEASNYVNYLISSYGEKEQTPIINSVENKEGYPKTYIPFIVINKIKWFLKTEDSLNAESEQQLQHLDIAGLFNIDRNYILNVEDATENTALIAVRIRKNWRLKGHVVWYSLDTLKAVTVSEVRKHKKT